MAGDRYPARQRGRGSPRVRRTTRRALARCATALLGVCAVLAAMFVVYVCALSLYRLGELLWEVLFKEAW